MGWICDAFPGHEGLLRSWWKDEYFGLLLLDTPPIQFVCDVQAPKVHDLKLGTSVELPRQYCLRVPGATRCRFCNRRLRPTHPTDAADLLQRREDVDVYAVQVACDCEWRSPLLGAPFGTKWHDGMLCLPESARETESSDRLGLVPFEAKCVRLWYEHCRQCLGADTPGGGPGQPRRIMPTEPEPPIDHAANREFVRRYLVVR